MDAVFWIVLGVVLAVAEIFTTTLFLIMFGVGAFAAAGAAALGAPVALQAVVFAVVSALSLAVVRPVIRRNARSALETGEQPFGVEAIEGSSAVVLEAVDADHGMVKIDGELWTARSYDATQRYAPGERVQVIKVRGATALVWQDDISAPGELPEARG
ncbi:Membrane protein implicated in regulation of membrane protease activity [Micromonospora sediminicola]|uniref:Membrane protein implicated in regulation of membrane protease activity n=1 Tax=Micromonospora sediminicola TaxID=946078 RepID=A0A1A9B8Z3_9ACTN|nr:NfeD family protein [Micromonospora sediminicola]SBT65546.1 Membrane protein implicated in regulation of membrane protease activity [Micromonospora sediminicola]